DREADACDAGRVGHREVVARADRDLRLHLDLAAEVHQEGAVRDGLDADLVEHADGVDDALPVDRVGRVDRYVADHEAAATARGVVRAQQAARLADGAGNRGERAGVTGQPDAHGQAVGGGGREHGLSLVRGGVTKQPAFVPTSCQLRAVFERFVPTVE